MEKKYLLIIGIIVLAVIIAGAVWYKISPDSFKSVFSPAIIGEPKSETTDINKNSAFPTRKEVPANVSVPEPGSNGANADVAVPKSSIPAAPGLEDKKLRTFDIVASGGKYSPSTIIVNIGDTVHVNFKAEDNVYDIFFPDYGLYQQAKQGETRIVEFGATTDGQFSFYCENACPRGKMTGTRKSVV